MVFKFFDTRTLADKSAIKNEIISNKVLPEELQKPVIREFYKKNVH